MQDDPRIKVVLRRYRKDEEQFSDSVELIGVPFALLRAACRFSGEDFLGRPRELDNEAQAFLAAQIGMDFDPSTFDYFLHPYVRKEFISTYYDDPSIKIKPCSESGPPAKMPIPAGMEWVGVRPKNGKEHFVAIEKKTPDQPPEPTPPSRVAHL
ncbi:MAG TPA: hypothetical protein VK717_04215 [Opitutaceae bacterium]|jgi:hypothetical protein|nr:hypothetical protein [Opitutaceae bacterium]